jgi:lipopolysaccharide export system permease protein
LGAHRPAAVAGAAPPAGVKRMRIHDRHVLRIFFRSFLISAAAFTVLVILGDIGERMDDFLDHQATTWSIVRYYAFKLPDIVRLTLPLDMLLATIFTLGFMGRHNELVALMSNGVSLARICAPILVVAAVAVIGSWFLSERLVPFTNRKMLEVRRVEIEKRPPLDAPVRRDFTFRGDGGALLYVRMLDVRAGRMTGIVLHRHRDGRLISRLDAESADWRDGYWEFHQVVERRFEADAAGNWTAGERSEQFRHLKVPELAETPEQLARVDPRPEAMSFDQLRRHAERMQASGGKVNDYLVDLYAKTSYPFTNLILALLGIGMSASKRRTSLAAGFGITVGVAFFYLGIIEVATALGKNEAIPPLLAAWLAPLVFGTASAWLLLRANR